MGTATQFPAKVVRIGPDVEPFAANDAKIDFRQANRLNLVRVNVDKPRLSFDDLSFPGQLIEGNALLLNSRHHWRSLIKISTILCESGLNLRTTKGGNWTGCKDYSLPILRICHLAKFDCSHVLLIFAHQEILDLCPATNYDQKQPGREGIQGTAVTNLLRFEPVADNSHHIVAGHSCRLID